MSWRLWSSPHCGLWYAVFGVVMQKFCYVRYVTYNRYLNLIQPSLSLKTIKPRRKKYIASFYQETLEIKWTFKNASFKTWTYEGFIIMITFHLLHCYSVYFNDWFMSEHIQQTVSVCNQRLYFLCRLKRRNLPVECLELFFDVVVVVPTLMLCITCLVWWYQC